VRTIRAACAVCWCLIWLAQPIVSPSLAQNLPPPTTQGDAEQELISLQFPPNLELKVLIQYVGLRLGINFIYDEQAVSQRITIVSPARISKGSLLGLLQSALKMKGLAVVDGDQPGWKKILPANNLASAVTPTTRAVEATTQPAAAVTQIFVLRYAEAQRAESVIKSFLSQPGGNSVALPDQRLLIVSDFASVIGHVAAVVRLLDQPPRESAARFIPVRNLDVSVLLPELQQILGAKEKAQAVSGTAPPPQIQVLQDQRTNQLILIGPPEMLDAAATMAQSLDVALPLETKVYSLKSLSPERLDRLVRELIDPLDAKRLYQAAADKEGELLVVTTTPAIHQKIAALKAQLDVQATQAASPIRFYKLTNSTAADVLATIRSLEETESGQGHGGSESSSATSPASAPLGEGNAASSIPPDLAPSNPQYHDVLPMSSSPYSSGTGFSSPVTAGIGPAVTPGAGPSASSTSANEPIAGIHTAKATITADPNTNTIIVKADPATQKMYENLIKSLDKRRPQVLIECTLVTLDTSDDFSLGVELGADTQGNPKVITFNSFGLSTPSPTTGMLALTPAAGFNGTLLGSSAAQVVIQALATSGRARVLSAPRILVNDNATGTLQSVQEQPYTSVNASTTVATTSFAGYADAGTTITFTPHISEGDHLQLEYNVSLNNFTGSASNGIPPPRQTDSVQSKITVPDDSTVIVGGLNTTNSSQTRQTIPFLGDIPLLKELVSQQSRDQSRSTLFVFIRPLILRDDQFDDLKYFSQHDADEAGLPSDYPKSTPLLIP
jgi:general secretion pathway protein D